MHEYNVGSVLKCILPYHENPLFGRMLQLLHIADTKWEFLEKCKSSGSVLSRATLVQRCITDPSVLDFILQLISDWPREGSVPHVVSSLLMVTVIEVLDRYRSTPDHLTRKIVAVLRHGMRRSFDRNLVSACHAILSHLCVHTVLMPELAYKLFRAVSRHVAEESLTDAVLCLTVMSATQQISAFPEEGVKAFLERR